MENMEKTVKDPYKFSRILYIIEATLEYFISMAIGGAYLAKVSTYIGLPDEVTGILSSFVSLGCGFQLIAIFLANKRPVKIWVTILHTLNQIFFALVYVVPFFEVPKTVKVVAFIVFLLAGHIVNNIVNSPKINWYMALVPDKKRGAFTANKEIVSLMTGIVFSFGLGAVIDFFEEKGDLTTAFILCGVGVFVLALLHTLTLILSKEKPAKKEEKHVKIKDTLKELVKDKNLMKVVLVSVLWNVANYTVTPFTGTYQNNELGFTMLFVSALSIAYAIVRSCFSRPMGKFADKYSFTKMLNICFIIMILSFLCLAFTTPANGKVMYTIYYMLTAIGMAGINSGAINLIYDYVKPKQRTSALALKSTLAGFAGFFTTLAVSSLVKYIQRNGNKLFGISIYAQQVMALLGVLLVVVILVYVNTVVKNIKRAEPPEE